jgi:hypothetical protein
MVPFSQGVAPGYAALPLRGEEDCRIDSKLQHIVMQLLA